MEKKGCIGRLTFPGAGQILGCIHIPRVQLPPKMLQSMDQGKYKTISIIIIHLNLR